MALLTPSRPPRTSAQSRSPVGGQAATPSQWLSHPMADVFLVAVPSLVLMLFGTLMVWSASSVYADRQFDDPYYFIKRHAVWVVVSLIALVVAARFPVEKLKPLGLILFGLAGVLLVLTFTPLGYGVGGNRNWLNLGGPGNMLRLQPAEIAKLAIVVWGAQVLATKRKLLDRPAHLLVPFLPLSGLLLVLVVLQRDLGTAMILGFLILAMLWCVGASFRVLGGLVAIVGAGVAALVVTNPSRLTRILAFMDPTADPTGTNHQPLQALYGLATGGWFGVGLGRSRQKWGSLSEAHTDYVLAVIGEELGVVVTLCVIALFFVLAYGGIRIALRSSSFFGRLVAAGLTCWLTVQALINIMVVLRMLPVLGVPLPFVSYGGSALLSNAVAVGILIACALDEPAAKAWRNRNRTSKNPAPRRRLSAVLSGRRPS